MADTKPPSFRSDAEKKKWSSLEHKAGHSLQKIAAGQGTKADFETVSKTLGELSKLAKKVFNDAVKSAEKQANLIQKTNLKKSKEDQEAFEKTVAALLKEQMPELIAQIKDIIQVDSLEQDARFEKTLTSQLENFASFLPPRDLPTTDDVLSIHEASLEQQSSSDDRKWDSRQKAIVNDIVDRVSSIVKATIEQASSFVKPAPSENTSLSNIPLLPPPSKSAKEGAEDVGFKEKPSVATAAMAMLQAPVEASRPDWEVVDDEADHTYAASSNKFGTSADSLIVPPPPTFVKSQNTPRAQPVEKEGQHTFVSLSNSAEKAIVDAANAQTKLHSELRDLISKFSKPSTAGDNPADEKDEDEEKKADTWWRSFGKWMGEKYDSAKEKLSTGATWLKALGTGLLSLLLAPKLYETIAQKAKQLFTWDNIKSAAAASWQYMYDKGKGIVEWVSDKLGLGRAIEKAQSWIHWIATKLGFSDDDKKQNPAANNHQHAPATTASATPSGAAVPVGSGGVAAPSKPKSTVATKGLSYLGNPKASGTIVPSYSAPMSFGGTSNSSTQSMASTTTVLGGNTNSASTVNADMPQVTSNNSNSNSSTVISSPYSQSAVSSIGGSTSFNPSLAVQNSNDRTTSMTDNSVKITPPVTIPMDQSTTNNSGNRSTTLQSQSSSIIGIRSFGINSGVDDSLALMNLGVISG